MKVKMTVAVDTVALKQVRRYARRQHITLATLFQRMWSHRLRQLPSAEREALIERRGRNGHLQVGRPRNR